MHKSGTLTGKNDCFYFLIASTTSTSRAS